MINYTYIGLIILGISTVGICAYLPVLIPGPFISFLTVVLSSVLSLLITFIVTKKWLDDHYEQRARGIREENERRVKRLKREHDTSTLERTIRDGTQTLIKNALDYFKLENIKNEIGSSAAIENLQLDKYGQIIELLADFSLILPDIKENQRIVEDEISHQINIYRGDENPFSVFLERIMKKYTVTVTKKIKEKNEQDYWESMKTCPQCAEKVLPKAKVCKHCGFRFQDISPSAAHQAIAADRVEKGRNLYKLNQYDDALKEFDAAIGLKANYATAYYLRAIVHNKLGKRKQAEADLQEASYLGHKKAQKLLQMRKSGTES